ncbi:MAG: UDP-N-acetylglucosamine 4,6-dehydratase (inverting) [Candidatus Portnoybacteria bacterium]|nr:UDP-N-acetylglucosamine 4,6-dehydratase (inverting) [Candidatus Portnoybacteria bacterium]
MNNKSKSPLYNKTILITGGTGSLGKACVNVLLKKYKPKAVRVYSRDELKQWEMCREFNNNRRLRFFIGDVRDLNRLKRAVEDVDIVIHAAALKQLPSCEYNPIEAVRTNIDGAVNVIDAALDNKVEMVLAVSTDKAVNPINLYGATKLCAEKLFIQANNYRGEKRQTKFSVVRYGNVLGSRGSVVPLFYQQREENILTVTDKRMTRFWITLPHAIKFVLSCFELMRGGEIFIPKIPSMKVIELAKAIAPRARIKFIGQRTGEKIHEYLITPEEAGNAYDLPDRYTIVSPTIEALRKELVWYKKYIKIPKNFEYNSLTNQWYLTKDEMGKLLSTLTI